MPLNFWIIVAVQFLIFLSFVFYYRNKNTPLLFIVLMSAIFGCFIGVFFDVLDIPLQICAYFADSTSTLVSSLSLTLPHLILNGIFSFGLMVAVAFYIAPLSHTLQEGKRMSYIAIFFLVAFFSSILLPFMPINTLQIMVICGIAIISLGELIILFFKKAGPVCTLLATRNYKPFLLLWTQCVLVGLLYEIINYYFPFWIWLPGSGYSRPFIELVIIGLGYVTAVHPMIIFWQLLDRR